MTWFNNLRIGVRLAIGFGTLVVALLIVAFVGASGLGSAGNATKDLANHDVKATSHIATIIDQLGGNEQKIAEHLYVEDGDLKAQDGTAKEIADNAKEIDGAVAQLRKELSTDQQRKALDTFVASHQAYMADIDKAIDLSRKETLRGDEERAGSRGLYKE